MTVNKLKQYVCDNIRTSLTLENEYTKFYLEEEKSYYIFIREIAPSLYSKGYKIYGKIVYSPWLNCNVYSIVIDWSMNNDLFLSFDYKAIYDLDELTSSMIQEQRVKEAENIHMPCE